MNASNSRAVDAIWCVDEAQAENIFSRFETAYSSQGDCDLFSGNCNRFTLFMFFFNFECAIHPEYGGRDEKGCLSSL